MARSKTGLQLRRLAPKSSPDFYPTPAWITHALMILERFPTDDSVWEPACGEGHMSKVIQKYCPNVYSSDLHNRGYGTPGINFLHSNERDTVDHVITNPPFNLAEDFLVRALEVARKRVVFLQRTNWLEGQKRYQRIFSITPPARVWISTERLGFTKGMDDGGGSMVAYAWYVFDKEVENGICELKWVPPGFKQRFRSGFDTNTLEEFL